MFKVRIYVNHKPVGWARQITHPAGNSEWVLSPNMARATPFAENSHGAESLMHCVTSFPQPERETSKSAAPAVTFRHHQV